MIHRELIFEIKWLDDTREKFGVTVAQARPCAQAARLTLKQAVKACIARYIDATDELPALVRLPVILTEQQLSLIEK